MILGLSVNTLVMLKPFAFREIRIIREAEVLPIKAPEP